MVEILLLIGIFDTSISFQFQNFPQTNFSRFGGLYGLLNTGITHCLFYEYDVTSFNMGTYKHLSIKMVFLR